MGSQGLVVGALCFLAGVARAAPPSPIEPPQPLAVRAETAVIDEAGGSIWIVEERGYPDTTARDTWRFDLNKTTWERIATPLAPPVSSSHHVTLANGALWIVGGYGADNKPFNDVWRFDIAKRTWEKVTFKGAPRGAAAVDGVFADKAGKALWITGGAETLAKDGIGVGIPLGTWQIDVEARTWTRVGTGMPPTSNTALLYDRDRAAMWMVAGYSPRNLQKPIDKVFQFKPRRGWKQVKGKGDAPSARSHLVGAIMEGAVWVFAGTVAAAETFRFDIKDSSWRRIAGGPPGGWDLDVAVDPRDKSLWVVGTSVTFAVTAKVEHKAWRLDAATATWHQEAAPPGACGTLLFDDTRRSMWCVGAGTWQLDLTTKRWRDHVALPAGWTCAAGTQARYEFTWGAMTEQVHHRGCAVQRGGAWTWHGAHVTHGSERTSGTYKMGKRHGPWIQHLSTQAINEDRYRDGLLDGTSVRWDRGTKTLQYTYRAGRLHGQAIDWWPTGKLKKEATYALGLPDGRVREFLEDGTPSRDVGYRKGKLHGPFTTWHAEQLPNKPPCCAKHKHEEGTYVEELKDGLWRAWYTNGKPLTEQRFKRGKPDGRIRYWNPQGQVSEIDPPVQPPVQEMIQVKER